MLYRSRLGRGGFFGFGLPQIDGQWLMIIGGAIAVAVWAVPTFVFPMFAQAATLPPPEATAPPFTAQAIAVGFTDTPNPSASPTTTLTPTATLTPSATPFVLDITPVATGDSNLLATLAPAASSSGSQVIVVTRAVVQTQIVQLPGPKVEVTRIVVQPGPKVEVTRLVPFEVTRVVVTPAQTVIVPFEVTRVNTVEVPVTVIVVVTATSGDVPTDTLTPTETATETPTPSVTPTQCTPWTETPTATATGFVIDLTPQSTGTLVSAPTETASPTPTESVDPCA